MNITPGSHRPQSNRPTRPVATTPTPPPARPNGAELPSWEELLGRR